MNNKLNQWRTLIARICLVCLLISLVYLGLPTKINQLSASAQSDLKLKSDIISLQARIGRLEQEVSRLRSSNTSSRNSSVPPRQSNSIPQTGNPPVINGQPIGKSDPMFKRLATLVIELKEDIRNIEQRLTKVEQPS